MVKSFIIVIVVAWILLTSFTAYLTFYQRYIPKNAHVEPIYFQYGHLEQQPEGRLEFTGPDPYSTMLRHEQAYDVSIHLHVPTSDINFNLGNFMVTVELETKNGTVLAQSSRPVKQKGQIKRECFKTSLFRLFFDINQIHNVFFMYWQKHYLY